MALLHKMVCRSYSSAIQGSLTTCTKSIAALTCEGFTDEQKETVTTFKAEEHFSEVRSFSLEPSRRQLIVRTLVTQSPRLSVMPPSLLSPRPRPPPSPRRPAGRPSRSTTPFRPPRRRIPATTFTTTTKVRLSLFTSNIC